MPRQAWAAYDAPRDIGSANGRRAGDDSGSEADVGEVLCGTTTSVAGACLCCLHVVTLTTGVVMLGVVAATFQFGSGSRLLPAAFPAVATALALLIIVVSCCGVGGVLFKKDAYGKALLCCNVGCSLLLSTTVLLCVWMAYVSLAGADGWTDYLEVGRAEVADAQRAFDSTANRTYALCCAPPQPDAALDPICEYVSGIGATSAEACATEGGFREALLDGVVKDAVLPGTIVLCATLGFTGATIFASCVLMWSSQPVGFDAAPPDVAIEISKEASDKYRVPLTKPVVDSNPHQRHAVRHRYDHELI